MKHITTTSLLAALFLNAAGASAEKLSTYRGQFNLSQEERDRSEKASQTRILNLRQKLGHSKLRFIEPRTPYVNATRGVSSSLFLKRLLSKVGEGFKSYESYGKPMTLDPSLFGYEIDTAVDNRNQEICMGVIGADKYGKNRDTLINQIYGQIYERQKLREANLNADAANGYQSELSNAIIDYVNRAGQGGILARFGTLYQIEVIDGIVTRLRFTKNTRDLSWMNQQPKSNVPYGFQTPVQPKFPHVIQPDTETLTLSLEMLATMVSDYDRYFIMGTACLANLLNTEIARVNKEYRSIVESKVYKYTPYEGDAPKLASQLGKLQAVKRYVDEKHEGALHARKLVTGLKREQIFFLMDLFLQFRRDDIPVAQDIEPLTALAYWRQKSHNGKNRATNPPTATTNDQIFYANLEEELFRVEEYMREYEKTRKVNQAIIEEIKGGRP